MPTPWTILPDPDWLQLIHLTMTESAITAVVEIGSSRSSLSVRSVQAPKFPTSATNGSIGCLSLSVFVGERWGDSCESRYCAPTISRALMRQGSNLLPPEPQSAGVCTRGKSRLYGWCASSQQILSFLLAVQGHSVATIYPI